MPILSGSVAAHFMPVAEQPSQSSPNAIIATQRRTPCVSVGVFAGHADPDSLNPKLTHGVRRCLWLNMYEQPGSSELPRRLQRHFQSPIGELLQVKLRKFQVCYQNLRAVPVIPFPHSMDRFCASKVRELHHCADNEHEFLVRRAVQNYAVTWCRTCPIGRETGITRSVVRMETESSADSLDTQRSPGFECENPQSMPLYSKPTAPVNPVECTGQEIFTLWDKFNEFDDYAGA